MYTMQDEYSHSEQGCVFEMEMGSLIMHSLQCSVQSCIGGEVG